jgi:glutamate dehydrogenase
MAELLNASLLPGDPPFGEDGLEQASRFVLAAASERMAGTPSIQVDSQTLGAGERQTRIAVINDNMPFLVDSISTAVSSLGLAIDRLVHPVAAVTRRRTARIDHLYRNGARRRPHPREAQGDDPCCAGRRARRGG